MGGEGEGEEEEEEEEDGERTREDDGGEMGWEEPGGMHQYSSEDERVEIIHQGKCTYLIFRL